MLNEIANFHIGRLGIFNFYFQREGTLSTGAFAFMGYRVRLSVKAWDTDINIFLKCALLFWYNSGIISEEDTITFSQIPCITDTSSHST
jgi:hypothetical protein